MMKRPPIVVVLGSVDHGKTTLLDHIRKSNVADREAGGITQAVGAYEIAHAPHESQINADNKTDQGGTKSAKIGADEDQQKSASNFMTPHKITFIDTPGHEAFTAMRTRGCHCADIGVLIVAADDSVKPQTRESIKILRESKTPFVVAINKTDLKNANIDKVKNDLMQEKVLLEGYGGDISFQEISAKTGAGIEELLDLILLVADVEGLTYNPKNPLEGFVLEAHLDKRRGVIASIIVQDGTINIGDEISAGGAGGKVKALTNFLGQRVKSATASSPVQVLGFESLPSVGDVVRAGKSQTETAEKTPEKITEINEESAGADTESIKLVLRADVSGSLEALAQIIEGISTNNRASSDTYPEINIVDKAVGEITDGDVKTAISTGATIIGFKSKVSKAAQNLARAREVKIVTSDIVYDLIKEVEGELEKLKEKAVTGKLEILAIFGKKEGKQIIGGKVTEGLIVNQAILDVERGDEIITTGKIVNLQHKKQDAKSVEAPKECGLLFEAKRDVKIGDILIAR
jgi:translation initiation factor IF-2